MNLETLRGGNEYVRKENRDCLIVYEELQNGFAQIRDRHDPFLNLIAIFYHDFMRIITNYLLKVEELEKYPDLEKQDKAEIVNNWPNYIDYEDVLSGIEPDKKIYQRKALINGKSALKARLRNFALNALCCGREKIVVSTGVALGGNISARTVTDVPRLQLPEMKNQLKIMSGVLELIWRRAGLDGSPEPMIDLLTRHVKVYEAEGRDPSLKDWSCFVSRHPSNIGYRIIAALCRAASVPVVNVMHGAGDGLLDEPILGRAQKGFASAVLGYGPLGRDVQKAGDYSQGFHGEVPYLCSDGEGLRKIYRPGRIQTLGNLESKKIFYITTAFTGRRLRYGPFRDIPDPMYLKWQTELFNRFPRAYLKAYPRERYNPDITPENAKLIVRRKFEDCYEEADVFFFDHISTAFFFACATDKPIVYFDIGLRNLTDKAYELINKRCLFIAVDPESPGDIGEKIGQKSDREFTNELLAACSFHPDGEKPREIRLREWVAENKKG